MGKEMSNINVAPIAYRIANAVAISGCSRTRLYKAIQAGELQAFKAGRQTIITDAELRRWLASFPTIGRVTADAAE
jgi:excisionase family DNA binding protein